MTTSTLSRQILTGDAAVAEGNTSLGRRRPTTPAQRARMVEAARLYSGAMSGNARSMLALKEAMSTSDFPDLLGQVFSRELMSTYEQMPSVWSQFARRSVVNDFREKSLIDLLGGRGVLDLVPELTEYPARKPSTAKYPLKVAKYGGRITWSWEMSVNDDLDAFRDLPNRLAQGARDTEDYVATGLLATATGPNTAFFKSANGNAPAAVPLTADNLTAALTAITTRKDSEGRPITISGFALVVPPALEIAALNIVNATEIRLTNGNSQAIVGNWLRGRVQVVVDPWLSVIDVSAKSATTWYVVPAPAASRPALVLGFLRGNEQPDLRYKADGGTRPGGGAVGPEDGSFDVDDVQYRVRHVLGGATVDPIATYASTGS